MKDSDKTILAIILIVGVLFFAYMGFIFCSIISEEIEQRSAPPIVGENKTIEDEVIEEETESPVVQEEPTKTARDVFNELSNIPYKVDLGPTKTPKEVMRVGHADCDDLSLMFASELYKLGYRDIYLVALSSPGMSYGHMVVQWNGFTYDITEGIYKMENREFERRAISQGFTYKEEIRYYPGMWGS